MPPQVTRDVNVVLTEKQVELIQKFQTQNGIRLFRDAVWQYFDNLLNFVPLGVDTTAPWHGYMSWRWLYNYFVFLLHGTLRPTHKIALDVNFYYPRPTCVTCYPNSLTKRLY